MPRTLPWIATSVAAVAAVALCVIAYQEHRSRALPETSAAYHAVALANGQVFFGRVSGLDGPFATLRDVFYIQARQNPDSKDVANVLVKRGAEAHQPDRMMINRDQIVLVEPVGADSRIARLIAEQSRSP